MADVSVPWIDPTDADLAAMVRTDLGLAAMPSVTGAGHSISVGGQWFIVSVEKGTPR